MPGRWRYRPGREPPGRCPSGSLEETGWSLPLDLAEVWHRRHVAVFLGQLVDHIERWFLAKVPAFSVDPAGFTELERRTISTWRWWPVADLHDASERLVPADPASRVDALLGDGPPRRPVNIGA